MGQEFFGGPEYFQEFDPEKFARDLKAQAEEQKAAEQKAEEEEDGTDTNSDEQGE